MSAGAGTGVAKASFSIGGSPVIGVVPNTQGKVVVLKYRGAGMSWVARLNSDGTIDPTFGSGEGLSFVGYASGISIDASGSVTIAVDGVTGLMSQAALIRLTPDGRLDGEFNPASAHQGLLGAQEYGVAGLSGSGPVTAYGDAGLVLSLRRQINSQSWHPSVALLRPDYSSTLPTPSPPIPPPLPTTRDYVPVVPVRMLETRATEGQVGFAGGKPGPGAIVELQVIGRGSPVVPVDASAVAFNLTGVNASGAGFVTVWPCGQPRPWASSLNLTLGDTRANLVISKVGDGGKVCLYTNAGTDLVADLNGWYPAVTS
jgi:hypothetical protein